MRLTRAGEYGVRCILHLAAQPPGTVVKRREIADRMDIPYPFLGKIGPTLAAAGILRIAQGTKGGYALRKPAEDISLLEVVEALDGAILLNDCLMGEGVCRRSPTCPVHEVWAEARDNLRRTLGAANFADLVRRGNCLMDDEPSRNTPGGVGRDRKER
jgi:Rrf2 family protein